ncbi:hypothetical protein WG66_009464 [Moniliophthora roreri]|nr:hypothetical protein WG66_009464 [Moniliophthora roreri]
MKVGVPLTTPEAVEGAPVPVKRASWRGSHKLHELTTCSTPHTPSINDNHNRPRLSLPSVHCRAAHLGQGNRRASLFINILSIIFSASASLSPSSYPTTAQFLKTLFPSDHYNNTAWSFPIT